MTETLLLPFQYGYMVNAMWVSALVGGVCASTIDSVAKSVVTAKIAQRRLTEAS